MNAGIPSDRKQLNELGKITADIVGKTKDPELKAAILNEYREINRLYFKESLRQFGYGKGDNKDMQALVVWHWPYLLERQPEMPFDWWQCEFTRDILAGRHTNMTEAAIKGCTKAGKGFSAAIAANLWWQDCVDIGCKIIVTSNTAGHAKTVLMAEIIRQRKKMQFSAPGRILTAGIKLTEDKYIQIANPAHGESFSGHHSEATAFFFDEASGVPSEYYALAETQAAIQVALSNPRNSTGWFNKLYPAGNPDRTQVIDLPGGGKRAVHTIGGKDCINVREGRKIIPAQIDAGRYARIIAKGGRWARVFGDGKFPIDGGEDMIIGASWIDRHVAAFDADTPITAFGLDVSASIDGDQSILTPVGAAGMGFQKILQEVDTMEVVDWVLREVLETYNIKLSLGYQPIAVDMDGLGKGVGDRLRQLGCWVVEIRGNAQSDVDPKIFGNLRAECYGMLGLRLNPKGPSGSDTWGMPDDHELHEELVTPKKVFQTDGIRWYATPKRSTSATDKRETVVGVLGRSPDKADSAVYAYKAFRTLEQIGLYNNGDIVASGRDPEAEARKLTDSELDSMEEWYPELAQKIKGFRRMDRDGD